MYIIDFDYAVEKWIVSDMSLSVVSSFARCEEAIEFVKSKNALIIW